MMRGCVCACLYTLQCLLNAGTPPAGRSRFTGTFSRGIILPRNEFVDVDVVATNEQCGVRDTLTREIIRGIVLSSRIAQFRTHIYSSHNPGINQYVWPILL